MILGIFLLEYIVLAIINYYLLQKPNLKFKQNKEFIEPTKTQRKILTIIMSIFWIYYTPKLYFDSWKEK